MMAATLLSILAVWAIPSPVLSAPAPIEIHELTLQEKADMVAESFNISTTTLANLIYSESRWKPDADNGYDRGLVQISRYYHPEVSDDQAFDVDFSLNFAAQAIARGDCSQWTACNCYSFVLTKVHVLPLMKDIVPNTNRAVGVIAIFQYPKSKHIAYVTEVHETYFVVAEANYHPALIGPRKVKYDDPAFLGFYKKGTP
jgi:hypothetical protein